MIEQGRQIIRKVTAFKVAFGIAVRVFCKVYRTASRYKMTKGDSIKVDYTLKIN